MSLARSWLLPLLIVMTAMPSLAQFHAGSRNRESGGTQECVPPASYIPDASVNAEDGFSTRGRRVTPATLDPSPLAAQFHSVDIDMHLPLNDYIRPGRVNANTSEMRINLGTMNVGRDGTTTLNGAPLASDPVECR